MTKKITLILLASALLIAGVFIAGCTQDAGATTSSTPITQEQAAATASEENVKPSGTPPEGMAMNSTAMTGERPEGGKMMNGTAPQGGNPPEGMEMNGTRPSGTPPGDMQGGGGQGSPSGTPPEGTPPSGTPQSTS